MFLDTARPHLTLRRRFSDPPRLLQSCYNRRAMKVLITFTGSHDPYSSSLVQGEEQPGPVLSLIAARKFEHVILLSTPKMNGTTDQTAAAVIGPAVSIRAVVLPDPTDYLAILREIRREWSEIREQFFGAEFFVATASGTPQMHACWFLLT